MSVSSVKTTDSNNPEHRKQLKQDAENTKFECNLKCQDLVSSSITNDGTQILAVKSIPKNTVIYKGTAILSYNRSEKETSQGLLCSLALLEHKTISALTLKLLDLWPSACMPEKLQEIYKIDDLEVIKGILKQPEHLIVMWSTFNHFEMDSRKFLFLTASKFNHSCDPNCRWELDSKTSTIVIRSLRDIAVGEPCTISYMVGMETWDVAARRKALLDLFFVCECTKCVLESKQK
jgi:hypothetical protein